MSDLGIQLTAVSALLLYKLVSLAVGMATIYLGYRLFAAGIWGGAGDLDARFGDAKIVMRGAAPGTFFALFGALVIGFTIWKGFDVRQNVPMLSSGAAADILSSSEPPD